MAGGPVVSGGSGRGRRRSSSGSFSAAWVLNLLTDLAFNLLIFFVVIASNDPVNKGRSQQMPAANKEKAEQKGQNIEVWLKRQSVSVNTAEVPLEDLAAKLQPMLAAKASPEDKIVVLKSDKDTPYDRWVKATGEIEKAGGLVALQLEEEKETVVK